MKAKSLVFMLCIGLMCFTGFGFTTADLTENSTTETIHLDASENVVTVFDLLHDYDSAAIEAARLTDLDLAKSYESLFADVPALYMNLNPYLQDIEAPPNIYKVKDFDLQHLCNCTLSRNPRDGISRSNS